MKDVLPEVGTERTVTWYAWLPVYIDREVRWLEYVTVRQLYAQGPDWYEADWENVAFVDDEGGDD